MRLLKLLPFFCFLFPFLVHSQASFKKSRAKIKRKNGINWIKFVRISVDDGVHKVFLKNISSNVTESIKWEVFPSPEGFINFQNKAQTNLFSGFADLSQQNVVIDLLDEETPLWRLSTPSDTAYLGKFEKGENAKAELYKLITSTSRGLTRSNSDRKVAVKLASFIRSKPDALDLNIKNSGKLDDYPYEFGIISTLLFTLFMLGEK